jgi:hypothetical protein
MRDNPEDTGGYVDHHHEPAGFNGAAFDRAAEHVQRRAAEYLHAGDLDTNERAVDLYVAARNLCTIYEHVGRPHDKWGDCRGHCSGTVHVTGHHDAKDCDMWDRRARVQSDKPASMNSEEGTS